MRHIDVHTIAESIKTSSEENICHFVYNCFESKSFAMWLLETFKLCIAAVRRARRWVGAIIPYWDWYQRCWCWCMSVRPPTFAAQCTAACPSRHFKDSGDEVGRTCFLSHFKLSTVGHLNANFKVRLGHPHKTESIRSQWTFVAVLFGC